MKRTSSDSNFRNLTPTPYPQWVQQQNNQTIQPNNEHYLIDPPILTDDLYAYLVDPLSRQDFERAMRIAGVKNLSELLQLTDTYKRTLLMFAGMSGNTELIKILLSSASNPDVLASMKDANGMSALIHAIKRRKPEPIKALLDNVKNPEQLIFMTNDENKAALRLAIEQSVISDLYGNYGIIIEHYPEMVERENKYQTESIKVLLSYVSDKDALIRGQDVDGREMLKYALRLDNAELLKILLDSVNNPEELLTMQDSEGKNLLLYAASKGKVKSIEVILRSVKNPDALASMKDVNGMTALICAVANCNIKSIKAILSGVKDPDALASIKDANDMTALMYATLGYKDIFVKTLLDGVNNPDALACVKDENGKTALGYAIEYGGETVNAILSNVSNADHLIWMKNDKGMTLLNQAAKEGSNTTAQALLDYVKNPAELIFFPDNDGKTALIRSTKNGNIDEFNVDVVTTMLEGATKVRDPYYRMSPKYKKGKNAYISIDRDALIFLKDSKGMNAFMYAVKYSNEHTMLKLFNWATDKLALLEEKNNANETALDLIEEEFCDHLIEILEEDNSKDVDVLLALLIEKKASF